MIKQISTQEILQLKEISIETFADTFASQNDPKDLQAYLEAAYDAEKLLRELQDKASEFYFIYDNNNVAGYLKINIDKAQTEPIAPNALEIERIYVRNGYQRKGLGEQLFNHALLRAKVLEKDTIWLGVWEKNEKAIKFYKKLDFQQKGTHSFYMGEDEQIDLIMVKPL